MKLTEKDIQVLRSMNQSEMGKSFADLLERKKVDVFAGGNVTKDTIDEANGRVKELDAVIQLIRTAEALGVPKEGEFES